MATLAGELKRARMQTERKQRQIHAICLQPGQEAMAESTIARAEKPQTLARTGDIGLFKVAYLAYLYGIDLSRVVVQMFPSLEPHAAARLELMAVATRLSPARMRRVGELVRELVAEQGREDAGGEPGGWREVERTPIELPPRPRAMPDDSGEWGK